MLATDILEMYHKNFTIAKIKILISITLLLNLGWTTNWVFFRYVSRYSKPAFTFKDVENVVVHVGHNLYHYVAAKIISSPTSIY